MSTKGLVWEYADAQAFADVFRPHLLLVLKRMLVQEQAPVEESVRSRSMADELVPSRFMAPESALAPLREQVRAMAQEYEHLRATQPSDPAQTRGMTLIETQMRALALSLAPLLDQLTASEMPGERLAAIAVLKELPDPQRLTWLAERVGTEKPFIGYHATLALQAAARVLGRSHLAAVKSAVQLARDRLRRAEYQDPEQRAVLDAISRDLKRAAP